MLRVSLRLLHSASCCQICLIPRGILRLQLIFSFSLTAGKAYRLNYAYSEQGDSWAEEVRDDVIEECAKNGGMFLVLFGFGD